MKTATMGSFLVLLLAVCPVWAGVSLDLQNPYELNPNSSSETIQLVASGDVMVDGVTLFLQVGGGVDGPPITDIRLADAGMIFNGGFGQAFNTPGRESNHGIITLAGSVLGDGLLATVTFDTTGLNSGTWPLSITYDGNDSHFIDAAGAKIPLESLQGTAVTIVPEPSTLALLAVLLAGAPLLIWYRRRRK